MIKKYTHIRRAHIMRSIYFKTLRVYMKMYNAGETHISDTLITDNIWVAVYVICLYYRVSSAEFYSMFEGISKSIINIFLNTESIVSRNANCYTSVIDDIRTAGEQLVMKICASDW